MASKLSGNGPKEVLRNPSRFSAVTKDAAVLEAAVLSKRFGRRIWITSLFLCRFTAFPALGNTFAIWAPVARSEESGHGLPKIGLQNIQDGRLAGIIPMRLLHKSHKILGEAEQKRNKNFCEAVAEFIGIPGLTKGNA